MNTTTKRHFHPFQEDYMRAQAMLECLRDRKREAMEPHAWMLDRATYTDSLIEQYTDLEMAVEEQLGIRSAEKHFQEAQVNLFGMARRELERLCWQKEGYRDVLALFERRLLPSQIQKLADICMKLQVGS